MTKWYLRQGNEYVDIRANGVFWLMSNPRHATAFNSEAEALAAAETALKDAVLDYSMLHCLEVVRLTVVQ